MSSETVICKLQKVYLFKKYCSKNAALWTVFSLLIYRQQMTTDDKF